MKRIVSISPGIQHNEINKDCECDGVDILAPTPNNVDWDHKSVNQI